MNHLEGQSSPYLLQHLHNPVDWYPWSEATLLKAQEEDRLLVISIGYAACHWCHVMEKESFEDEGVATLMNRHFVSIKVDREERPDVDQVYMFAAYAVHGRGGWPLNVVALPDGRPIYAGTYFPKRDWLYLLNEIANTYQTNREQIIQQAETIHRRMKEMERKPSRSKEPREVSLQSQTIFKQMKSRMDFEEGGTLGAPKFPMPGLLHYLLLEAQLNANEEAKRALRITLDKMACGGIYDHLGGGFARYSTDDRWHVPHFEKMLYDNAQLISLYSKAYLYFQDEHYRDVVAETIGFIQRELMSAEKLFYASLDADSEGKEGAFYCWTEQEIDLVLGDRSEVFKSFFGISKQGNWEEGCNVLWNRDQNQINPDILEAKERLFAVRMKREHPPLDNKSITSWNALMISACVDTYKAIGGFEKLEIAEALAEKIYVHFEECGSLSRLLHPIPPPDLPVDTLNSNVNPAFLDDYAFTIQSYIDLYQVTFHPSWLTKAEVLVECVIDHFFDSESGLFFYTSTSDSPLIDRRMEFSDSVIPSSNAIMANSLFQLGTLLSKGKWQNLASAMVETMQPKINSDPSFYACWTGLHLRIAHNPFEVSIVGENWRVVLDQLNRHAFPNLILMGGEGEDLEALKGKAVPGKTVIYICRDKTCSAPFDSVKDAIHYLQAEIN